MELLTTSLRVFSPVRSIFLVPATNARSGCLSPLRCKTYMRSSRMFKLAREASGTQGKNSVARKIKYKCMILYFHKEMTEKLDMADDGSQSLSISIDREKRFREVGFN